MKAETVQSRSIYKIKGNSGQVHEDVLSIEEPLEIRLAYGPENQRQERSLSITMRTPGHDYELAIGFLFTEGIIESQKDVMLQSERDPLVSILSRNTVVVQLAYHVQMDWSSFSRHFYTNSSCGICGKTSIESLEGMCTKIVQNDLAIEAEIIHSLNDKMRAEQGTFNRTGSLHAAALFNAQGDLIYLKEDIGRHNALDKIIGAALIAGAIPLERHIIMLSGRSCFELIQKALKAEIPIMSAVGAPSSLAVNTAESFGLCLLGFAKNNTFNIYSSPDKIRYETAH